MMKPHWLFSSGFIFEIFVLHMKLEYKSMGIVAIILSFYDVEKEFLFQQEIRSKTKTLK